MSTARCSVCHCYSRNCPEGLPNHRGVPVGPNCPMNTQGRHYRDPADPTVPVCDYTGCTFFTVDESASVPYPTDVSLGPVVTESPQNPQSSDVAAIMLLLHNRRLKMMQEMIRCVTCRTLSQVWYRMFCLCLPHHPHCRRISLLSTRPLAHSPHLCQPSLPYLAGYPAPYLSYWGGQCCS